MDRPRLGERPRSYVRSKATEYLIAFGCIGIASMLFWRVLGDRITAATRADHGPAVVIGSPDECLGGLCTKPAGER